VHTEPLPPRLYASRWSKVPFLRGTLALWDALGIGIKALLYSADVALEEEEVQLKGPAAWATIGSAAVIGLGLFFAFPALVAALLDHLFSSAAASNAFEGLLRLALLVGYVWAIAFLPNVRRVYAYHGAEHKAINALEAGAPLEPWAVARYSTRHVRCGTSFLLLVVVFSTFVFALLGQPDWWLRIGSRIVFIPLIAAVAYEAIKFGARFHERSRLVRWLMAPGLALQALTTREPDLAQLEVALAALREVLHAEHPEVLAPVELAA
jgi:uncharacterized protein YqhQ